MHERRYGFPLMIPVAGALMAAGTVQFTDDDATLQVRVVDASGAVIDGAEAFLVDVAYGMPITRVWTGIEGDLITISADNVSHHYEDEEIEGDVRLIVRAPDHAWTMRQLPLSQDGPTEVTLDEGRPITLRLEPIDGRELPDDLEPIIYTETLGTSTWLTCVQGFQKRLDEPATAMIACPPVRRGAGEYLVRVPADVEEFHVLIDHPGFLRVFEHGPIVIADLEVGVATIELPQPVALNVELAPQEGAPAQYEACGVNIMHSPTSPKGWSFHVGARFGEGTEFQTTYDDLAPAAYSVDGFTGTRETRNNRDRPDYCEVRGFADLTAEAAANVTLHLETFDEAYWKDKLRGDYNLTLDLNLHDGTPAAGKAYEVSFSLRKFGKNLEIIGGEVPENGLIELSDLPAGGDATIMVLVDDKYVDEIFLRGDDLEQTREYALAPTIGDRAPDFEFTGLASGETLRLANLRGQVVFLEFWAAWCGPCQEPMMHSNELMNRRGNSWGDLVTILGISIDNEIETIREHVNGRDWNAVKQVWVPGAWKAESVKAYAVTSVPSAFLIDPDGVIVWAGHPTEIKLEKRIEELLQK